jgi:3-oxoacyl-[acyl-carrier protein] reductase
MGRLDGKTAIITGAASGFGEGMAIRFAEEGARVVVADLNGVGAMQFSGRIDIMVNNAGYTHRNRPLAEVEEHEFDLICAVNMKAIYHSTLAVLPVMRAQGAGVILNTASTAALRPRPGLTWYNASKGWVVTATKSMAAELAPEGIRVNCLCPVAGDTGMLALFMGEDTPEMREKFKATIPMGRLSTPLDIANAALWLASEEASFVTGVALEVDGGRCI